MNRRCCTALLVSCALAVAADPAEERRRQLLGDTQEHFDTNIGPLTKAISGGRRIAVYEGLPHPYSEPRLYAAERKTKGFVERHGFPFYDAAARPGEAEEKTLTALCGNPATFSRWEGEKACGGFHPDWCLEWPGDGGVHRLLICFGCGEGRLFGPERELRVELSRGTKGKLFDLLKPFRKHRPVPDE